MDAAKRDAFGERIRTKRPRLPRKLFLAIPETRRECNYLLGYVSRCNSFRFQIDASRHIRLFESFSRCAAKWFQMARSCDFSWVYCYSEYYVAWNVVSENFDLNLEGIWFEVANCQRPPCKKGRPSPGRRVSSLRNSLRNMRWEISGRAFIRTLPTWYRIYPHASDPFLFFPDRFWLFPTHRAFFSSNISVDVSTKTMFFKYVCFLMLM